MISYWEKESFIEYDAVIIGSGIVGLSTAISLKEKSPNLSILVLERGLLPTGASTKNAGFACFGSLTELINDLNTIGESGTLELVNERWEGLKKLRSRIGDENFDYYNNGGYELIREKEMKYLDKIEEVNELLSLLFDKPVFQLSESKIKEFGFNESDIKSMIFNQYEGQIHTGKMMSQLIKIAQKLGVSIWTGAEVQNIIDSGDQVEIDVKNNTNNLTLKAGKVAVCTNAFTNKLINNLDIAPGRGIVLVTKPIKDLPFQGVFHIDEGYYYFRNEGKRVIFGGGRNMDFKSETTTSLEINQQIEQELRRQLKEIILPNHHFEVEHTWAGIMAFGENKVPIFKEYTKNIHLGVRLGGMGVAIGSQMGEKLAQKML
ncbi:NAD(P)/FAD-dependent oxidoreductase [Fulvivirga lutea]|uniref:FAD-binding oxidoreductase n=1 Tax=Fulvivirga lutea TaxID=2810512 RepID=A0A975A0Y4_9BACT|nr:FAD-dependent oxidoreductase [Fulvivirga lutea]QSE97690.1 FAD-binding oxidoreductase [Fulvivirga lutea]